MSPRALVPFVLCAAAMTSCNCGGVRLGRLNAIINPTPAVIDFGRVTLGTSEHRAIMIANEGDRPLNVFSLEVMGGPFLGATSAFRVEGGRQLEVVIAFVPNAVGRFDGRAVIESDADNEEIITIELTGVGVEPNEDAHTEDGGTRDAGRPDAGKPGTPDAGRVDAGRPDGGCFEGETQACSVGQCGSGRQLCRDGGWQSCMPCVSAAVGAQCLNDRCCIPSGLKVPQSGSLIGTQYTHCITDPIEGAGLSVGLIIDQSTPGVHASVRNSTRLCCSGSAMVATSSLEICPLGVWRIECR